MTAEVSAVPRPSIDADGNEVESVPVGTIRIATYEGLVAQAMHIRHFEGSIIITEVNQATQLAFAAARFSCSGRWRAASFVLRQQKCKPLASTPTEGPDEAHSLDRCGSRAGYLGSEPGPSVHVWGCRPVPIFNRHAAAECLPQPCPSSCTGIHPGLSFGTGRDRPGNLHTPESQ
jgi:hypothetical protein